MFVVLVIIHELFDVEIEKPRKPFLGTNIRKSMYPDI